MKRSALESKRRTALIEALQAREGQQFSASELKVLSGGVPKSLVRRLLKGVDGVTFSANEDAKDVTYSWATSGRRVSKTAKSGLDVARETFENEQLMLPPVPDRFKKNLRVIKEWCFATRTVDAMRMYMFEEYLEEVLTKKTPDYVAFSHAGHGTNSYALNYQLVDGPLAILVQSAWGGVYTDRTAATQQANALFARCAALVSASERVRVRGLASPPGRLIVIESEMRGDLVWGWLERPLRRQAVREWMRDHSVNPSADTATSGRADLPTVAALEWLDDASAGGPSKSKRKSI